MRLPYPVRLCSLLTVLLSVASCRGATTHLYRLSAVPAPTPAVYAGQPVRLDAVHVPRPLDRVQLLRQIGSNEYQIDDTHHWAAPFGESVKGALGIDLVQRLPSGLGVFPQMRKPSASLGVTVEILQFELVDRSASMQAAWSIGSDSSPGTTWSASRAWTMPAGDATPEETARVLSALLGSLADAIVADLARADQIHYFQQDAGSGAVHH